MPPSRLQEIHRRGAPDLRAPRQWGAAAAHRHRRL